MTVTVFALPLFSSILLLNGVASLSIFGITESALENSDKFMTYSLPDNTDIKRAMGYSETSISNFTQIAANHGYSAETHSTLTDDGYILTLFRIPRGKNCKGPTKSPPVLMMHGLLDSSDTFIVAGPGIGLAYILADQCYDVWCGNTRGNTYSRKHKTLNPDKDGKFWDFTFDQFGKYDQPAMIDYVLCETGHKKLHYIGHSQGTTSFFVMGSTRPEYNEKIQLAVCLAPVAWMHNMFNPLFQFISKGTDEIKAAAGFIGLKEIFGNKQASAALAQFICEHVPGSVCKPLLFLLTGNNPKFTSSETVRSLIGRAPAGTSVNNLVHFGQGLQRDGFRYYDFKEVKNLEVYGQSEPQSYDVTKVSAPVALFWGKNDWMSNSKDVAQLRQRLPNLVEFYTLEPEDWSHVDFTWGDRIPQYLSPHLIKCLEKYS